jgi:hypothetical protein
LKVQRIQDREKEQRKSDLQICIICLSIERECVVTSKMQHKLEKLHNQQGENDWEEDNSLVRK